MKSVIRRDATAEIGRPLRLWGTSRERHNDWDSRPTARERELIALIAQGHSNKIIAHELKISPNTVRAHIGNIMRKYKLRNRTQIAMLLMPILRTNAVDNIKNR